jgi:hypothetical protein
MWTPEHRAAARRQDLRYASELTDEEWALVAPMIPPARRGGRPRSLQFGRTSATIVPHLHTPSLMIEARWD